MISLELYGNWFRQEQRGEGMAVMIQISVSSSVRVWSLESACHLMSVKPSRVKWGARVTGIQTSGSQQWIHPVKMAWIVHLKPVLSSRGSEMGHTQFHFPFRDRKPSLSSSPRQPKNGPSCLPSWTRKGTAWRPRAVTALGRGIQNTLKRISTAASGMHANTYTQPRESCTDTVQYLYLQLLPVQTPSPVNWILAYFQCLRACTREIMTWNR